MRHITEDHGQQASLLEIRGSDLDQLKPFLQTLGVRLNVKEWRWEDGGSTCIVDGENPYKAWSIDPDGTARPFHVSFGK